MEFSVSASLYPQQIIIVPRIGDEFGSVWIEADSPIILPIEISDEDLGSALVKQLALSTHRRVLPGETWDLRERYRSLAGFKAEGQLMKNAKLVVVLLNAQQLHFEPKNNRYSRIKNKQYEFQGMSDAKFSLDYPASVKSIGVQLRKAWELALIS